MFVTSYDTELRKPIFFVKGGDAGKGDFYEAVSDVRMFDAAMATSAAPTYFPPHKIDRPDGHYSLVDGGVYANNPAGLAHSMLRTPGRYDADVVLSLGTGSMERKYLFDKVRKWGAVQWAAPLLKMTFDGQTEAVALALERRLAPGSYFRFQYFLSDDGTEQGVSDDLDDATPANIARMEEVAARIIDQHAQDLERLYAALGLAKLA